MLGLVLNESALTDYFILYAIFTPKKNNLPEFLVNLTYKDGFTIPKYLKKHVHKYESANRFSCKKLFLKDYFHNKRRVSGK